ncbi:MAG: helix-turn-helix transcriptional regulator [Spirochaetes bacterium]|nr:helix-turn-helix transcriptional regulator [Spirochaetota bacterium]
MESGPRSYYLAPARPGPFARLQPRLLSVAEYTSRGRWIMPPQIQDFYTLSFVQAGASSVTAGGATHRASPGEILLYSPKQPYRAKGLPPFADYRTIIFRFTTGDRTPYPVRFHAAALAPVRRVLTLLLETVARPKGDERAIKGLLLDLLALAVETWTPTESRDALRCREASALMARRLSAPFALSEYARIAELSPSRFAHVFRAHAGESPREHFMGLKCREAKRLLAETEGGVTSVADALGFSSIHHFSRWFTALEGRSPTAFLKRLRADLSRGERIVRTDGPGA